MKKLVFTIGLSAATMFLSAQQVWYVRPSGAGVHNGTSWNNAFKHIQDAINATQPGDEIWVAQGHYYENLVIQTPQIAIYGGFRGNETQVNQRNWRSNQTVIDGGTNDRCVVIDEDNCRLDGFIVQNGQDPQYSSGSPVLSGGILVDGCYNRCQYGIPVKTIYGTVLKNLIVQSNKGGYGGGIRLQHTKNTLLQNIEVYSNSAFEGAGIWMAASEKTKLVNVLVYDNHAYCNTSTPPNRGSGLFVESSDPTLINVTIADNGTKNEDDKVGNGIYSVNSLITLYNTIVDNGITVGILRGHPWVKSAHNIISHNSMLKFVYVSHIYLSGHPYPANLPIDYYPIFEFYNSGVGNGGGINGSVHFLAQYNMQPPPPATLPQQGYVGIPQQAILTANYIYPTITLFNSTAYANPMFVGGTPANPYNYHLLPSSPCIDAGNQTFVNPYTKIDLDGYYRVAGNDVDMGVYEFGSSPAPSTDVNEKSSKGNKKETRKETIKRGLNLYVYPNPANEDKQTTIYLGAENEVYNKSVEVKIYAMDGRLLYNRTFPHGNIQADLSELIAGTYSVQVQTQEGKSYRQILVIGK